MPTPSVESARADRYAPLVVAFAVSIVTLPLALTFTRLPAIGDIGDAYTTLAIDHCVVDAFRRFGELPAWNPFFGGGIPWAGHPLNPGISPAAWIHIAFGEVGGVKVVTWLALVLGGCGTYASGRRWFGLEPAAALLSAAVYVFALWTPCHLIEGNYSELGLLLLPTVLAGQAALLDRRPIALLLPLVYVAVIAESRYGFLVFAPTGVLVPLLSPRRTRSGSAALLCWALPFAFGLLLAAPKLLPLLDLAARDLVDQKTGAASFFYPSGSIFLQSLVGAHPMIERHTIGVGWGAAILALLGLFLRPRAALVLVLVTAGVAAITIDSTLSVRSWLSAVPVLSTMRDVAKYWNATILLAVALLAGLGFDALTRRSREWPRPARLAALVGLAALVLGPPLAGSVERNAAVFAWADREVEKEPFRHAAAVEAIGVRTRVRAPQYAPWQYWNTRRGIGTITWYGLIVLPEAAVPTLLLEPDGRLRTDPDAPPLFRPIGDCTLESGVMTYETITLGITAGCRKLVVNQNFDPGWTSSRGTVVDEGGLLAVALHGDESGAIELRFVDRRHRLGLVIAAVAAVLWTAAIAVRSRRAT